MKYIINKIISGFCIVISINACHTLEHHNIFLENIKRNSNKELFDRENENIKINEKKIYDNKLIDNNEMAPIDVPKQKEKVQKLILKKNAKFIKQNVFNLNAIKNWTELELIKKLGKGDFIKEEGKLKNYQYYYSECFLDVFVIKKGSEYLVNYIETRPTKLDGEININACLKEIKKVLN